MKFVILSTLVLLGLAGPGLADSPPAASANSATVSVPRPMTAKRLEANLERSRQAAGAVDWVLDGDSITDFWQAPRLGGPVFAEHFGKRRALDFAVAGDRTQHVLWRLEQGQVDGLDPKLITLMIGTNNLKANSDAQIADGIAAIVADYRRRCPDAVILLQGILPRGATPTDPARPRIKAINERIARFADGQHVIFVDFGAKFLEPDGTLSREVMPDFLHPSAKGYEIWAAELQPFVAKYLPAR